NQATYGAMFPHTLRTTPLLSLDGKSYNLEDWQNQARRGEFENAIATASTEAVKDLVDDLKAARDKLQFLAKVLGEKMGDFAPHLVSSENNEHIGAAVSDCLKVANQMLQRKTGGPITDDGTGNATGRDGHAVSHSLSSRADA